MSLKAYLNLLAMAGTNQNASVDWEQQLAAIIERSNTNLTRLTTEYNEVKSKRPSSSHTPKMLEHSRRQPSFEPQPITKQPCHKQQVLQPSPRQPPSGIHERRQGSHEKAAYDAFNATISRPAQRSLEEDKIMQRVDFRTRQCVERALKDQLVSTSRAIDALRDQIYLVGNEVRDLNDQSSRTAKSISAQERRIDAICHDVDSKRGAINGIEEHLANEIRNLKREVKSTLESSALSAKMTMSSSLRDAVSSEMESVENDINVRMASVLKNETNRIEKRCIGMLERAMGRLAISLQQQLEEQAARQQKETLDSITKIVTLTVSEVVEKNLTGQLTKRLELKADELKEQMNSQTSQPAAATAEQVDALHQTTTALSNELVTVKEELHNSDQVDALSSKVAGFEKRIDTIQTTQCTNNADILSMSDSLSQQRELIAVMESRLVTKEEMETALEQLLDARCCNIFQPTSTDEFVDNQSLRLELDTVRSELQGHSSKQFSDLEARLSEVHSLCEGLAANRQAPEVTALPNKVAELAESMDMLKSSQAKNDSVVALVFESLSQNQESIVKLENSLVTKEEMTDALDRLEEEGVNIFNHTATDEYIDVQTFRSELDSVRLELAETSRSFTDLEARLSEVHSRDEELAVKQLSSSEMEGLSNSTKELEDGMYLLKASQDKNATDITSVFDSLSRHEELIAGIENNLLTKEAVRNIMEQSTGELADTFVDNKTFSSKLEALQSELKQRLSTVESFGGNLQAIEGRVDELDEDFRQRLNTMLDVVESTEQRVACCENGRDPEVITSEFFDALASSKSEFISLLNEVENQSKSDVALIKKHLALLSEQLSAVKVVATPVENGNSCKTSGGSEEDSLDQQCPSPLGQALRELQSTLIAAKESAAPQQFKVPISAAPQQAKSPTPASSKPDDLLSPSTNASCVHLMGLGSPGSITTADTLSISSPRQFHLANACESSPTLNDDERLVVALKYNSDPDIIANEANNSIAIEQETPRSAIEIGSISSGDAIVVVRERAGNSMILEEVAKSESNTPLSQSSATMNGSISTADALSVASELVDGSIIDNADVTSANELIPLETSHVRDQQDTMCQEEKDCHILPNDTNDHLNVDEIQAADVDASSVIGSLTSYDEVELTSDSGATEMHGPRNGRTALHIELDIDVYERWEQVLSELIDYFNNGRGASYYDESFESEN